MCANISNLTYRVNGLSSGELCQQIDKLICCFCDFLMVDITLECLSRSNTRNEGPMNQDDSDVVPLCASKTRVNERTILIGDND